MTTEQPRSGVPVLPEAKIKELFRSGESFEKDIQKACAWGADEQLMRCAKWLFQRQEHNLAIQLQKVMRPKPPSLKQAALHALGLRHGHKSTGSPIQWGFCNESIDTIRRALEALPDDD
jgi:hypothetical protein